MTEDFKAEFLKKSGAQWVMLQTRLQSLGETGKQYNDIINNASLLLLSHDECREASSGMAESHYNSNDPSLNRRFCLWVTIDSPKRDYYKRNPQYFDFEELDEYLAEANGDITKASELFCERLFDDTIGKIEYNIEYNIACQQRQNAVCMPNHPYYPTMRQEAIDRAQAEMYRLKPEMKAFHEQLKAQELGDLPLKGPIL